MAGRSAIAGCVNLYGTFASGPFPGGVKPNLYFDEVPAVDSSGVQQRPPFVCLKDEGTTPVLEFERNVVDVTRVAFEVVAYTLEDVDAIVERIKYNGGAVGAGAGFDDGTLPSLSSGSVSRQVRRTAERRFVAGWGPAAQRVHTCRLEYEIQIQRSAGT